ncbi:MAG TPA: hypothetical protein DCL18_08425 [Prevotella sp.]|nr:hypothetical protein [Prevotella sp.]
MNVKSIIIVVIGLLVSVTAYSQQPKETTIDLLTHTVWEHGKPIYGDYCQISYTDSIVTLLYKNADDEMKTLTWRYYLTNKEEYTFDKSKIGKRVNGDYYMTIDKSGTFTSFKILELGKDKLAVVAIRVNGGERTPCIPWDYTPLKR